MKKVLHMALLEMLALGLVSCSTGVTGNLNRTDSSTDNSASTETSVSTEVLYNGSYYYVFGSDGTEIPIVNKHYPITSDYDPGENAIALAAFRELQVTMQAAGFAISSSYSGYRSYETQATLYQSYVNRDGQEAADTYSARAGHSEHQTGLAFDLVETSGQLLTDPSASAWLLEHAAEYGFIVRYQEGWEDTTGYMAEQWHVRYIGDEATSIAASGVSLEEYFKIEGGDYAE